MIIQSFWTSFQMENNDSAYLAALSEQVQYATSAGIELGGYGLPLSDSAAYTLYPYPKSFALYPIPRYPISEARNPKNRYDLINLDRMGYGYDKQVDSMHPNHDCPYPQHTKPYPDHEYLYRFPVICAVIWMISTGSPTISTRLGDYQYPFRSIRDRKQNCQCRPQHHESHASSSVPVMSF